MLSTVVKLFNAVNKHQKELDAKLKTAPTEAKKAKGINFFLLMTVVLLLIKKPVYLIVCIYESLICEFLKYFIN